MGRRTDDRAVRGRREDPSAETGSHRVEGGPWRTEFDPPRDYGNYSRGDTGRQTDRRRFEEQYDEPYSRRYHPRYGSTYGERNFQGNSYGNPDYGRDFNRETNRYVDDAREEGRYSEGLPSDEEFIRRREWGEPHGRWSDYTDEGYGPVDDPDFDRIHDPDYRGDQRYFRAEHLDGWRPRRSRRINR